MSKKATLFIMISRCLKSGKPLATWAIERMGRSIGIMGSSATRYARGYCEDGMIKKEGRHTYK